MTIKVKKCDCGKIIHIEGKLKDFEKIEKLLKTEKKNDA